MIVRGSPGRLGVGAVAVMAGRSGRRGLRRGGGGGDGGGLGFLRDGVSDGGKSGIHGGGESRSSWYTVRKLYFYLCIYFFQILIFKFSCGGERSSAEWEGREFISSQIGFL